MSQRDLEQSLRDLRTLVGRPSYFVATGSSLKVQVDDLGPDAPYIWIDPPWILTHPNFRVEAAQCPKYAEPDYEEKFKEWFDSFAGLGASAFEGFRAEPDGTVAFRFADDLELWVPLDPGFEPEPFSRYDHWYARA